MDAPQDPRIIGTAAQATSRGHPPDALLRVRRGVHVDAAEWEQAFPEQRIRVAAEALLHQARGAPIVFSHASAAAYWGLPLHRARVTRVHVVQTHARASSSSRVMRHAARITDDDVVWLAEDVGVTTLARTAFDMIRTLREEGALALMDAALRTAAQRAPGRRALNLDAAEAFRRELTARIRAATGARGIRQAREIVDAGDARAESVGESVSRLYLTRLGVRGLDLQVRVPGPGDRDYEVDFDLGEAWGEFDGEAKYTDPRFLRGRTPEQVLAEEKAREDWIRGTTGKPFARWGFTHLRDERTLARRLTAFGVALPNAPRPHLLRETTLD